MGWTIRGYDTGDEQQVVTLSLRAWAPVHESMRAVMGDEIFDRLHRPDWRASQQRDVEAALADAAMNVWVAEREGAVIGFVAATVRPDEEMGEIFMIAVDPDHQDRGLGTELTAVATDWIRSAGMPIALISTGGDRGHAPARRVYERAGFTPFPGVNYFKAL